MEKVNKKNITIIILSILLAIVSIGLISTLISMHIYKNAVYVTFSGYYSKPVSVSSYTFYEIEMSCNENQIVNAKDFTFQFNDEYRCASKILYNDKEYNADENFVIAKRTKNKLTVYFMIPEIINPPKTILYKNKRIEMNETIKA